jgi:hypothetical protein
VFEDFLLTFDDDFLVVRDGSDGIAPGDTQARKSGARARA